MRLISFCFLMLTGCQSLSTSSDKAVDIVSKYETYADFGATSFRCVTTVVKYPHKGSPIRIQVGKFEFNPAKRQAPIWSNVITDPKLDGEVQTAQGTTTAFVSAYYTFPTGLASIDLKKKGNEHYIESFKTEAYLSEDFTEARIKVAGVETKVNYARSPRNKLRPQAFEATTLEGLRTQFFYDDSKAPYLVNRADIELTGKWTNNKYSKFSVEYDNCEAF
jgi:hypothetical protein